MHASLLPSPDSSLAMESDHSEYEPARGGTPKRPFSDEASPPHPGSAAASTSAKKVRQRKRSKTACGECRARKQACDMKTPCNRCTKRSVVCSLESSAPSMGAVASTSSIAVAYSSKVTSTGAGVVLESVLRATLDAVPRRGSLIDIESAAAVLGALARSDGAGSAGGGTPRQDRRRSDEEGSVLGSFQSVGYEEATSPFAVLPPRVVCDHLLVAFFHHPAFSRLSLTPQSTIDVGLHALLESITSNSDTAPPVTHAFLALVSITLASALRILPEASLQLIKQHGEWSEMERILVRQTKNALDMSEEFEWPDVHRIEAMILYGRWMMEAGKPTAQYNVLARAIRSAQAMGLHHEGSLIYVTPDELQIHRRLWWCLYAQDRAISWAFDRPYVIQDGAFNVPVPAGVPTMTSENMPTNLKRNCDVELARIRGSVTDRVRSAHQSIYQDVLDSEDELVNFDKSLPLPSCQLDYDTKDQARFIPTEHRLLLLEITWTRSLLHRPYLLPNLPAVGSPDPHVKSRLLVVSSSQSIINQVRALYEPLSQKVPFHLFYKCFDPAVHLAFAILQDPTNPRNDSLDAWILEARSILHRMGRDHTVALEAIACIDALRQKIVDCARVRNGLATPQTTPYLADTLLFVDSNRVPTPAATSWTSSMEQRVSNDVLVRCREPSLEGHFVHQELSVKWPLGADALERVHGKAKWRTALQNMSM